MPRSVWCLSVLTPVSRSGTVFTCMCTESRVSLLSDLSCGKASIHSIAVTMWSSFLGVSCWQGVVINLPGDCRDPSTGGRAARVRAPTASPTLGSPSGALARGRRFVALALTNVSHLTHSSKVRRTRSQMELQVYHKAHNWLMIHKT